MTNKITMFAKRCLFIAAQVFVVVLVLSLHPQNLHAVAPKCVNIYFDQSRDPSYWMGKTYATLLQNLLGHFPEYQQIVSPIEFYKGGDIERCAATFYLGSYFDNAVPSTFFQDFASTTKRVAWLGYNIWNFKPEALARLFGLKYGGLTQLNTKPLTPNGEPTFFKNILYKGETFFKYGKFSKADPKVFLAPFEMTRLLPLDGPDTQEQAQVLARAEHNGTGEQLPYIVQKKNRFYIADIPFSYMHEADRYLVFSDLLFDILDEKPRHGEHYAFMRIEDVHPLVPLPYLYRITRALLMENIPINISLIPIFYDPLNEYARAPNQDFLPLTGSPEFMQFLTEMKSHNAVMIWHGTTHQLGSVRNPFSAVSGDDFEFWDAKQNRALAEDSSDFALDRLEAGFYELQKAGIFPQFWLTPHYQASPLDYSIFAHTMPWNIGRVIYFNHRAELPEVAIADTDLWFSAKNTGSEASTRRQAYFRQFKIQVTDSHWSGQIFPYEIYGDVYGQRLLPEDLGNSQPTANEFVVQPRTTQEMLADAKRNLVLRDIWGSFFYHPQLLEVEADGGEGRFPGDSSELLQLVVEMKKIGYKFIPIDEFAQKNQNLMRPQPIYIQAKDGTP